MPTMSNTTFKLRIGTEMAEGSATSRNRQRQRGGVRARSEQRDILDFGREDGQIDFEGSEVALGGGGERTGVVDALD